MAVEETERETECGEETDRQTERETDRQTERERESKCCYLLDSIYWKYTRDYSFRSSHFLEGLIGGALTGNIVFKGIQNNDYDCIASKCGDEAADEARHTGIGCCSSGPREQHLLLLVLVVICISSSCSSF